MPENLISTSPILSIKKALGSENFRVGRSLTMPLYKCLLIFNFTETLKVLPLCRKLDLLLPFVFTKTIISPPTSKGKFSLHFLSCFSAGQSGNDISEQKNKLRACSPPLLTKSYLFCLHQNCSFSPTRSLL